MTPPQCSEGGALLLPGLSHKSVTIFIGHQNNQKYVIFCQTVHVQYTYIQYSHRTFYHKKADIGFQQQV